MSTKNENITGLMFAIHITFSITNDELWDWANNQSVGTIHNISLSGDHVIVLPLWEDDYTPEMVVSWSESFYDFFVEKMI